MPSREQIRSTADLRRVAITSHRASRRSDTTGIERVPAETLARVLCPGEGVAELLTRGHAEFVGH